jgi:hypothetical protein
VGLAFRINFDLNVIVDPTPFLFIVRARVWHHCRGPIGTVEPGRAAAIRATGKRQANRATDVAPRRVQG